MINSYLLFRNQTWFIPFNITIIVSYLIVLYVAVTRIRWNYFLDSIHSGNENGISLTFDDGPNTEFTEKTLDILKKHQAKATFFIIGKNISGNENILKRIDNEGHIIGNHSYSHVYWFNSLPAKRIIKDIAQCNQLLTNIIGKKPNFFRIPFGLTSPNLQRALNNTSYASIGWDFRSFDTMAKSSETLLSKLKKNAKTSSIILLHDNNNFTLEALDSFLEYCTKNGIKIVSLDTMIGQKAYDN